MAKSDTAQQTDTQATAPNPDLKDGGKTAEGDAAKDAEQSAPVVSLDSYLRLCGTRPDQSAGFANFARRTIRVKLSMQQWGEAFAQFCANPVH